MLSQAAESLKQVCKIKKNEDLKEKKEEGKKKWSGGG